MTALIVVAIWCVGPGLAITRSGLIAGPGAQPGVYNGVLIARINGDISVLDFEIAVRDLLGQVEVAYWEVYMAYRALDSARAGRDSALDNWRRLKASQKVGREAAVGQGCDSFAHP